jgi:hypothetical protein
MLLYNQLIKNDEFNGPLTVSALPNGMPCPVRVISSRLLKKLGR